MTTEPKVRYYLGANSPNGFYSLYDQLLDPGEAEELLILKGGAGCGKSTLMRDVAARAEAQGIPVEYIGCSGDPDSWTPFCCPTAAPPSWMAPPPMWWSPSSPGRWSGM